jgi:hypothetical protein
VIFHSYVSHYQRVTTKTRTALSPAWPRFQVVSSDRIIAVDGFEGSGAALMDKAPPTKPEGYGGYGGYGKMIPFRGRDDVMPMKNSEKG